MQELNSFSLTQSTYNNTENLAEICNRLDKAVKLDDVRSWGWGGQVDRDTQIQPSLSLFPLFAGHLI